MDSRFDDTPETLSRYSDVKNEINQMLPPIEGFENQDLVSLEETVKPLKDIVPQVDHMVWTVKKDCKKPTDGLSIDESAAIRLYTLEWTSPENSFYRILNAKLRAKNRRELVPWFLYLRLLIHALSKLPISTRRVIYRGVKLDLNLDNTEDKEIVWWGFSSCSSSIGVLENHIGKSGKRTIFNIMCHSAVEIHRHSYYPTEYEVLLYPARQFEIKSSLDVGNGLRIIDLEETKPRFPLFTIPSVASDKTINILLLGTKGVGKTTFLNAFSNYLKFKTFEQAYSTNPYVLKPLSFDMLTNTTFEHRTIVYGDVDPSNQSSRQRCQTYTFDLNQRDGKKLCFIDTPSLEDTQDSANTIKHILDYVNTMTHVNAICFFLQPDASRLQNSFTSCFGQLLSCLGSNAQKNVIFCFTYALMALATPGTTASLLRKMFNSLSMNDIPFHRTNSFFFDNESFRFLMAIKNGIKFECSNVQEYAITWSECVQESNRLLQYILGNLAPYKIVKKK